MKTILLLSGLRVMLRAFTKTLLIILAVGLMLLWIWAHPKIGRLQW